MSNFRLSGLLKNSGLVFTQNIFDLRISQQIRHKSGIERKFCFYFFSSKKQNKIKEMNHACFLIIDESCMFGNLETILQQTMTYAKTVPITDLHWEERNG